MPSTTVTPVRDEAIMDERFMQVALDLARRGRGTTSPNPMVGAVVVKDGTIVGEGFHRRAGEPHAEVHALDAAGPLARAATLYCTLEPCCHTGRTGPCVERVLAAGIGRVVVAVEDPDPRVRGRGIDQLRRRGVTVDVGLARRAAIRLNETFFTYVSAGRPFVTMKVALSADARIAGRGGRPVRLTSDESNAQVHALRAEVDAIGVGSGTVMTDDPWLTARGTTRTRPLVRVVFDARLRTPPSARLFETLEAGPIVIVTGDPTDGTWVARAEALQAAGAVLERSPGHDAREAMRRLAGRGITSLVLEGGATLHQAVWRSGAVDRVQVYRTPSTIGSDGVEWFAEAEDVLDGLHERRRVACGPDVLDEGDVHRID